VHGFQWCDDFDPSRQAGNTGSYLADQLRDGATLSQSCLGAPYLRFIRRRQRDDFVTVIDLQRRYMSAAAA
jgi:hypothetical protein